MAFPSIAQTPRLAPDFYATVWVAGFDKLMEVRQSGLKRRVDVASGAVVQSFLTDRTRGLLLVMTAAGKRRLAFAFPIAQDESGAPLPLDFGLMKGAQRLTRMGGSNVGGHACALWRYVGYLGKSGTVCVAGDDTVLQMVPDGRKNPIFQVMSLTVTRQDPRWFTPPADYQIAVLPGTGGLGARTLAPTR